MIKKSTALQNFCFDQTGRIHFNPAAGRLNVQIELECLPSRPAAGLTSDKPDQEAP
jgi:hypothetical protein